MKTKNFKIKLQETIKQKGITNVKSMQLEVPEERFLISLHPILATVNSRKIDSFLKEYEKLIFRKAKSKIRFHPGFELWSLMMAPISGDGSVHSLHSLFHVSVAVSLISSIEALHVHLCSVEVICQRRQTVKCHLKSFFSQ